jgi:hypothetical protein
MYSHTAAAQAGSDAFSSPAEPHEQAIPDPAGQGRGWGRLSAGIHLGVSLAQLIGKDAPSAVNEHTDKPEIALGIYGRFGFSEWLSIQPEVLFLSKGRRDNRDGMLLGTLELDYFEVPLLARITIPVSERVAPYLLAGPAVGVLLRFQLTNESDGSVTDRTDQAKRIDVSGVLGAGVEIALTRQHGLTLEARYDRSFTRILKTGDDVKNRVFAFMLGYQYSFSAPVESAH